MSKASTYSVAVVGATGAVGRRFLQELQRRHFPVGNLRLFASPRSQGHRIEWQNKSIACEVLSEGCFEGSDFVFFDASDEVSRQWVQVAAEAGAWVIDNSAVYRMDAEVPLVVPELHGDEVARRFRGEVGAKTRWKSRVFAGPNCSTVQLTLPLEAIRRVAGIRRVIVSTYQSTSGAGLAAMEVLKSQTQQGIGMVVGVTADSGPFPRPIAFNCIPQIGKFDSQGVTSEENKLMAETRRILGIPELKIHATAVRVPTLACHAESVWVECEREVNLEPLMRAIGTFPGVTLAEGASEYRTGAESAGLDPVFVGRVRRDPSDSHAVSLWVVSDNLGKGAALNAIQIAELGIRVLDSAGARA